MCSLIVVMVRFCVFPFLSGKTDGFKEEVRFTIIHNLFYTVALLQKFPKKLYCELILNCLEVCTKKILIAEKFVFILVFKIAE